MPSMPTIDPSVLTRTARLCRERGIVIPTFAEQKDPFRLACLGTGGSGDVATVLIAMQEFR